MSPSRLGSREELAHLREVFEQAGYTDAQLRERVGVDSVSDLWPPFERQAFASIVDAQSLFVHLFLDGDAVGTSALRDLITTAQLETLLSFGLLHPHPADAELVSATVAIYPIEELQITSDRTSRPTTSVATTIPADLVRSPILPRTRNFLRLMPREPCDSFLELCGGSGAAALVAARRFAQRATVVDIGERPTRFASFNAALNQVSNLTILRGDLYETVTGQTYDVIVAQPPSIPTLGGDESHRGGGDDGEQITRRILQGAPNYLRPGGQLFVDALFANRQTTTLDEHVREMLGEASDEFDVVIAQGPTLDPLHFVLDQAREGRAAFRDLERWRDTFDRVAIDSLVFASVLLQRRSAPRAVVTTRRVQSPYTVAGDLQWVLRWMVASAGWTSDDELRLLSMRPRTLPHTELRSRSQLSEGQWSTDECALVTMSPFAVEATCPSWYATLLQWCDGRMTAREHLQYLRDTHAVPENASEEAFAHMIRQLVDAGLIEVEDFRLPDTTSRRDTLAMGDRARGGQPVERAD